MESFKPQITEYTWPEQEGSKTLETPHGVLSEELRMQRTSAELRESILGLDDLYLDTPLSESLGTYAATGAELIFRERQLDPDALYESIYGGSILGLYAGMYGYPQVMKNAIVEYRFSDTPDQYKYPSETADEYNNRCRETYSDDIDDRYAAFESLPEAEKPVLTLLAERACAHLGPQYEPYFIAGIMKSFHQLRPIVDNYRGQKAQN